MSPDKRGEGDNLNEMERALRGLVPQSSPAQHDRLLFAAGRQAERADSRATRRLWVCAASISSAATLVVSVLLWQANTKVSTLELALIDSARRAEPAEAGGAGETAVASRHLVASATSEKMEPVETVAPRERWPTRSPEGLASPAAPTNSERPQYLELRNRVLRMGIDALADGSPRAARSASAEANLPRATSRELRELYLQSPDRQPAG